MLRLENFWFEYEECEGIVREVWKEPWERVSVISDLIRRWSVIIFFNFKEEIDKFEKDFKMI